ncbi:MAG: hypothetical protein NT029_15505 [Armatimonadetes bacterium]|nr:hypothetical protein [Armatimonadota bacterium]
MITHHVTELVDMMPTPAEVTHAMACQEAIRLMISPWRVEGDELVLEHYRIPLDRLLREPDWEAHIAGKRWGTASPWSAVGGLHCAIGLLMGGLIECPPTERASWP